MIDTVRLSTRSELPSSHPLLLVVEGNNDFEFLVRLAARLRIDLPEIPDLRSLCAAGYIVPVLLGGGSPVTWPYRVAALKCREFHLYDREQEPETQERMAAISQVNARAGCRGFLTAKRSLENYLHPQAIQRAGGKAYDFADTDAVARLDAQQSFQSLEDWKRVPYRRQRRLISHAKRRLNTIAVEQMTLALLMERDPPGEVLHWFQTIVRLLQSSDSNSPSMLMITLPCST